MLLADTDCQEKLAMDILVWIIYIASITLSGDARKAMTNPASQEHSQRNKKHCHYTNKPYLSARLLPTSNMAGKYGLSQTSSIVAHIWRWYGPHRAKHSLPLILNMIIWTSFFFPRNTFRYFWANVVWAIDSRKNSNMLLNPSCHAGMAWMKHSIRVGIIRISLPKPSLGGLCLRVQSA